MHLNELPRDSSGAVKGRWKLRHRLPTFSAQLLVTNFVSGATTSPLTGRNLERVMASFGDTVTAEPWPDESPTQAVEKPARPKTLQELLQLTDEQLRAIAVDSQPTWGTRKLRRHVANQLGIEGMQ